MTITTTPITMDALKAMAPHYFGDMVKAVVDIRRGILALDAELHADLEQRLLEDGSSQGDLWGINLYPDMEGDDLVEFDSLINIRPWQHNRSRGIEDAEVRQAVVELVKRLLQ